MLSNADSESKFLAELAETRERVTEFYQMLELLGLDLHAEEDGYRIYFVIDYSELHRYLHPLTDRYRRIDPLKYQVDQLILHFLFEESSERLVFLPVYRREFRNRLETMKKDFAIIGLQPSSSRRSRRERDLHYHIERLKRDGHTDGEIKRLMTKYALELLLEEQVSKSMEGDFVKFKTLLNSGRLSFLHQVDGIEKDISIDQRSSEYRAKLEEMKKLRSDPTKYWNNVTDATAALQVRKLNAANHKRKHLFLLLSSSPLIRQAFFDTKTVYSVGGQEVESTILRTLTYVLIKFFYRDWNYDKAIKDIENVRSRLNEYLKIVKKISEETANTHRFYGESFQNIEKEVQESLWRFEEEMKSNMIFDIESSPDEYGLIKAIIKVVKDPAALKSAVDKAYSALGSCINELKKIYVQSFLIGGSKVVSRRETDSGIEKNP